MCQGVGPHAGTVHVGIGRLKLSQCLVALRHLHKQGFRFGADVSLTQPVIVGQGLGIMLPVHLCGRPGLNETQSRDGIVGHVLQQPVTQLQVILHRVGLAGSFEQFQQSRHAAYLPYWGIPPGLAGYVPCLADGVFGFLQLVQFAFDARTELPGGEDHRLVIGQPGVFGGQVDALFRFGQVADVEVIYGHVVVEVGYPAFVLVSQRGIQCLLVVVQDRVVDVTLPIEDGQVVVHADVFLQVVHLGQVGEHAFLHGKCLFAFSDVHQQGRLFVQQDGVEGRLLYTRCGESAVETPLGFFVSSFAHQVGCSLVEAGKQRVGRNFMGMKRKGQKQ